MSLSTRVRTCASLSLFVCAFGFTAVQAGNTHYNVGLQPLSIIPDGDVVHVFHNQVDQNFNQILEPGDQSALWLVLDAATGSVLDTKIFDWGGTGYPFRPFVDRENGVVYLSNLGRVRSFSLATRELVRDTVALYDASGIAVHGDNVYLSLRPSFSDPGTLLTYTMSTGTEVERTVGVNPQQIVPFATSDGAKGVLVLSEGGFGAGSAPSVLDKQYFDGSTPPEALELGATGNHIFMQGDTAFVTMNGSGTVEIVDVRQWTVVGSIEVVTEPGNGPRESVVRGDDLFVTTFDGDVRRYSVSTGALKQTFDPGGKPEGLALVGETVWVANAYQQTGFASDSTIAVWDFSTTGIADVMPIPGATLVPSVVTNEAELTIPAGPFTGDVSCTIVAMSGREVGRFLLSQTDSSTLRAGFSPAQFGLAPGRYFLYIRRGGSATAIPFAVGR